MSDMSACLSDCEPMNCYKMKAPSEKSLIMTKCFQAHISKVEAITGPVNQ